MEEREGLASIREVHALLDTTEANLSKEIADLKAEMGRRFDKHDLEHEKERLAIEAKEHKEKLEAEAKDRRVISRRRWMVTTALGFGTLLGSTAQYILGRVFGW